MGTFNNRYGDKEEIANNATQDELDAAVADQSSALSAANAALQLQISANDIDITALAVQDGNHDGQISALQATNASIQAQIDSNDTEIASLVAGVSSNDVDIAALQAHPPVLASPNVLGHMKVGSGLTVLSDGKVNVDPVGDANSPAIWEPGTGPIGNFTLNGGANENMREHGQGPNHTLEMLWRSIASGNGGADGGWNNHQFDINPDKPYRHSVFVKKIQSGGRFYLGTGYSRVTLLPTASGFASGYAGHQSAGNPYHIHTTQLPVGEWLLVTGYLHAANDPRNDAANNMGGIYRLDGTKISSTQDFKNKAGQTKQSQRCYQFYSTAGAEIQFARPTFRVLDGTEPSIENMLGLS